MTNQRFDFLTPVGRLVQGHPFEANDKNMEGKPLLTTDGKPRVQYFMALAIPKSDAGFAEAWAKISACAMQAWPNGEHKLPTFAWKYIDGDGAAYKDKAGFPGHHILKIAGSFAPKVYLKGGQTLMIDPKGIKRGDSIRIYISAAGNGSASKPGVYLNPQFVELVGYGEEIVTGPDASKILAGAPAAQLPPAASATPVASTPLSAAGTPPVAAAANLPALPGAPGNASLPGLPGMATPPIPATAVAPAPAPVKTMTAKAAGATYAQFQSQGWTDELLVQHGYMTITNGVQPAVDFLNPPTPR